MPDNNQSRPTAMVMDIRPALALMLSESKTPGAEGCVIAPISHLDKVSPGSVPMILAAGIHYLFSMAAQHDDSPDGPTLKEVRRLLAEKSGYFGTGNHGATIPGCSGENGD